MKPDSRTYFLLYQVSSLREATTDRKGQQQTELYIYMQVITNPHHHVTWHGYLRDEEIAQ